MGPKWAPYIHLNHHHMVPLFLRLKTATAKFHLCDAGCDQWVLRAEDSDTQECLVPQYMCQIHRTVLLATWPLQALLQYVAQAVTTGWQNVELSLDGDVHKERCWRHQTPRVIQQVNVPVSCEQAHCTCRQFSSVQFTVSCGSGTVSSYTRQRQVRRQRLVVGSSGTTWRSCKHSGRMAGQLTCRQGLAEHAAAGSGSLQQKQEPYVLLTCEWGTWRETQVQTERQQPWTRSMASVSMITCRVAIVIITGRFLGIRQGQHVWLTTLLPSVNRPSKQCGILNISGPHMLPRPVTGIDFLFFFFFLVLYSLCVMCPLLFE
jgi:hypothetical protein